MAKSTVTKSATSAKARAANKVAAPETKSKVESILTSAFTAGYVTHDWVVDHKKEIGLVAGTAAGVLVIQELLS